MVKNLGRKFATMSDDERRRFALEEEEGTREHPAELAFDDPRDADNLGPHSSIREEVADPEHRDGMSALLDDEQHERAIQEESERQDQPESGSE
jgi:hypothetical protein